MIVPWNQVVRRVVKTNERLMIASTPEAATIPKKYKPICFAAIHPAMTRIGVKYRQISNEERILSSVIDFIFPVKEMRA